MKNRPLSRIMFVDDEPDICEIAKLALEEIGGYTVECCDSGVSAVSRAPDFKPDMILLDAMMPDMDGTETMKALAEISDIAETPIVFVTAKGRKSDIDRYLELGAVGVISKPFDPIALSSEVDILWRSQ